MIQKAFADKVVEKIKNDPFVVGLAVGGSWITNEIDEFSDLDLILVTKEKISADKERMLAYARSFGDLVAGFTGEHVGESRLLICLYKNPLLHVDIKFLVPDEFYKRVETPIILWDRDGQIESAFKRSKEEYPYPDYQWIEDRFWVWVHYALLKIGRGEYFEALDFLSSLRMMVLGPLLHIKNKNLPKGVRKVEILLSSDDLVQLKSTISDHNMVSLIEALQNAVTLYQNLRKQLFDDSVRLLKEAEENVIQFLEVIKAKKQAFIPG